MGYMIYFGVVSHSLRQASFSLNENTAIKEDVFRITLKKDPDQRGISKSRKPEIKIGDEMYDIIGEETCGDWVTYICIRDHREENFLVKARQFHDLSSPVKANHKPFRLISDNIIKIALLSRPENLIGCHQRDIHVLSDDSMASCLYCPDFEHPPKSIS